MARAPIDQSQWQAWIDHVCQALGVDPADVDVRAIHDLTGQIANEYERPMAPVAAHLWGIARARGVEPAEAAETLVAAARDAGGAA